MVVLHAEAMRLDREDEYRLIDDGFLGFGIRHEGCCRYYTVVILPLSPRELWKQKDGDTSEDRSAALCRWLSNSRRRSRDPGVLGTGWLLKVRRAECTHRLGGT